MCAKYCSSKFKTVPWAQKVNFRQKNTKKVKEKNTFSPLTQKIIKISKNKKYLFKNISRVSRNKPSCQIS